jgi:NAD(P)-dependent dehydrogenase (short-subunit alcohol dehydrogenase family)
VKWIDQRNRKRERRSISLHRECQGGYGACLRHLEDLVQKYRDRAPTARLDVTDEHAACAAVQVAVDPFRGVWISSRITRANDDIAAFEQVSSQRFKALVETIFYGAVNMTRAALPVMRKQKSGYILQTDIVCGRPLGASRQHCVPCRQVGCWGIHRSPGPGSRLFRRQGVCARTRRNAN